MDSSFSIQRGHLGWSSKSSPKAERPHHINPNCLHSILCIQYSRIFWLHRSFGFSPLWSHPVPPTTRLSRHWSNVYPYSWLVPRGCSGNHGCLGNWFGTHNHWQCLACLFAHAAKYPAAFSTTWISWPVSSAFWRKSSFRRRWRLKTIDKQIRLF